MQKAHVSEFDRPWTRFFLVGQTGSGKTTVAGTFPRALFIVPANENSHTTLRENNVDAHVWLIESMADMETAVADAIAEYSRNPNEFYETIVIESLTHYGDLVVSGLTQDNQSDMTLQRWGQFTNHISGIYTRLSRLDAHLVMTSQAMPNDKSGDMEVMLQGRAKLLIPSACDAIGFCDTQMTKDGLIYKVYFRKHRGFPARRRYNWLPEVVDNFNFATYYNAAYNR